MIRPIATKFVRFHVGTGENISHQNDPWIEGEFLADNIDPSIILAFGQGARCKLAEIVSSKAYKRFSSRRLCCLNDILQHIPPPGGLPNEVSLDGKSAIKLKHA